MKFDPHTWSAFGHCSPLVYAMQRTKNLPILQYSAIYSNEDFRHSPFSISTFMRWLFLILSSFILRGFFIPHFIEKKKGAHRHPTLTLISYIFSRPYMQGKSEGGKGHTPTAKKITWKVLKPIDHDQQCICSIPLRTRQQLWSDGFFNTGVG